MPTFNGSTNQPECFLRGEDDIKQIEILWLSHMTAPVMALVLASFDYPSAGKLTLKFTSI